MVTRPLRKHTRMTRSTLKAIANNPNNRYRTRQSAKAALRRKTNRRRRRY